MARGGARTRSGPPPDPNALNRVRDEGEWTTLPYAGRTGLPPLFPLPPPTIFVEGQAVVSTEMQALEAGIWDELWRLPQAIMWEQQQQTRYVALYVRRLVEAEQSGSPTNLSTLVRQMADSLGLTTPGLRANRWRIESPTAAAPASAPASKPKRAAARDRFEVLDGGAA